MTINYQALAAEITADPLGLGYAALAGQDQQRANLINSTTGPGAALVALTSVPVQALIKAVQSNADWDLLTAAGPTFNSFQLLALISPLDCTNPQITAILSHVITGFSQTTKTAIAGAATKIGSRAENLFGVGTVVLASDIAKAEGRPG
jgi:hypothetical protein